MKSGKHPFDAGPLIPVAIRRPVKRRWRRVSGVEHAAEMIGPIERDVEICGLTNGQFSLIDMIAHVLDCIGPADIALSTWTMGIYEQEHAAAFVENGRIRRMRMRVDPSMFGRKPELAGALVRKFGAESFRAVNTHAKFCVLTNDEWAVTIRSSMNLNRNRRIEGFDISEDRGLADWFLEIVDEIWRMAAGSDGTQSLAFFEGILDKFERAPASTGGLGGMVSMADLSAGLKRIGAD